jgi:hypothetical protein
LTVAEHALRHRAWSQSRGLIFCCAHWAEAVGITELRDRVG